MLTIGLLVCTADAHELEARSFAGADSIEFRRALTGKAPAPSPAVQTYTPCPTPCAESQQNACAPYGYPCYCNYGDDACKCPNYESACVIESEYEASSPTAAPTESSKACGVAPVTCGKDPVTGKQSYVVKITPYTNGEDIVNVELNCNDGSNVWTSTERNLKQGGSVSCPEGFHSISTYDYGGGVTNIRGNCIQTGSCSDSDPSNPTQGGGWTDVDTYYLPEPNGTSASEKALAAMVAAAPGLDGSEIVVGVSLVPSCGQILLVKEKLRVNATGAWNKIFSTGGFPPASYSLQYGTQQASGITKSEALTATIGDSFQFGYKGSQSEDSTSVGGGVGNIAGFTDKDTTSKGSSSSLTDAKQRDTDFVFTSQDTFIDLYQWTWSVDTNLHAVRLVTPTLAVLKMPRGKVPCCPYGEAVEGSDYQSCTSLASNTCTVQQQ